uniref:F-box protein 36 n=1 Tax=Pipistrellus kuhlii TaxID=59472 RepID=A0A7J7XU46_PIPKU|nr:F-box protein 36 [Pipistrellus kuhlii]
MASWLPETLFEILGQGPAPSKDYYQLLITRSQVIFRWWKISLRSGYQSSTKPGEVKESYEDFLENSHLQSRIDFLERLSDNLLMIIISYLDIDDIASLSFTSHRFSKLCMSDRLWEPIVEAANEITPAMKALAQDHSWRQTFFTKKLQLRKKKRISENRAGNQ